MPPPETPQDVAVASKRRCIHVSALLGLAALALLGGMLRAWGLDWSVPFAGRLYLYHPDEPVLLHAVCSVSPLWGDVTPSFYNYGSLYINLTRLVYDLLAPALGWGTVPRYDLPFESWVRDYAHLLVTGRWVTVALGTATIALTYGLGRRLYSARTGWLAALFLAVAPLAVLFGHYMTVDVPVAFFTTLCLLLAAVALHSDTPQRRTGALLAAGFVAGLATGTKYNCFPVLLALAAPLGRMLRSEAPEAPEARRAAVTTALLALLLCGVGFLLATPGALLEPGLFVRHVSEEMAHNREGQGLVFRATPPALLYHLGISFPVGLEWPLWLLCLAGLGWALYRRSPSDRLLLLFVVPFFLLLLPAERKFLRYVTPLLPPLLLLGARWVDEALASRRGRVPAAAWSVLAAGVALASTIAHLGVLAAPDVRDQAAAFLRESTRPGDVVALGTDPWYYTPPLHPTAGAVKIAAVPVSPEPGSRGAYGGPPVWERVPPGQARPDLFPLEEYRLLAPPAGSGALSVEKLRQYRPKRVVLSDFEYDDSERVRRADPAYRDGTLALLDALRQEYHLERELRPRPSLFGFTWWRHGTPPHDWRYFMPAIRIYVRND
jgi:hypothetical protein